MPNWVTNKLRGENISSLPIFTTGENGEKQLDFNTLIPMPEELNIISGTMIDVAIEAVLRKLGNGECHLPQYRDIPDEEFYGKTKSADYIRGIITG